MTSTSPPTVKLCGISVSIFATPPLQLAPEINLGFLNSVALSSVVAVGLKNFAISVVPPPTILFDS